MKSILIFLPFIAVFLIYNFVNHALGIAALIVLAAALIILKRPTLLMLWGNSKYNKGDHEGGLEFMEKAYKTGKLAENMVVYYSYCLIRDNKNDKATLVLDKYISSGKGTKADICRAKHNKAIMLWRSGSIDDAFELMKEVHGEMPATDTYGTLGLLYIEKLKSDPSVEEEALSFLTEAYEYNSDDRTICDNLGNMYFKLGRLDEAEEIYKTLLATRQSSPTPYYRYAKILMAKENYEDAEDMLNHALRCSFSGVTVIKRTDVTAALDEVNVKLEGEKAIDN